MNKKIKKRFIFYFLALFLVFSFFSCSENSENRLEEFFIASSAASQKKSFSYQSYEQFCHSLSRLQNRFPEIVLIESIGKSVEGRDIFAVIISDFPSQDLEDEPGIRITSGIHGNEKIAPAFVLQFMEYLVSSYATDSEVKKIIDENYIAFIPIINPDGYVKDIRYNSNNKDLNRDFNDYVANCSIFSQPESCFLRDYKPGRFVCGISYHSGDYVISFPLGYTESSKYRSEHYELFLSVAKDYAIAGTEGTRFCDGICSVSKATDFTITGGDWYAVTGELSDWSYLEYGCIDITVEISKEKEPESNQSIQHAFELNKAGLLAFLQNAKNIDLLKIKKGAAVNRVTSSGA